MLTTLLGTRAAVPRGPTDDFWYSPIGVQTSAGLKVTPQTAASLNALMACVRVIAETLASFPLIIYRNRADGGKDRAENHPMYRTLKFQPNPWQTRFEFVEMLEGHILLRGNAFCEIVPTGGGGADLMPLNPDRMLVEQLANGRLRYTHKDEIGKETIFNQDEIFHVRGMSFSGLLGLDPVELGADTIGTAMAGERYAGNFYRNDGTPSGVLKHPNRLGEEAQKNLQKSFGGLTVATDGAHRIRILEEGMDWQQIGINAEEAQLIESRKFAVEEIARMMRVPPHLIQSLDKATFSNIEQQSLDFLTNTMRPWATRWELALQRDVIDDEVFFAEFLIDAQLRADIKTRYEVYSIGIASTMLSPNEARQKENMNPREGGDSFENPNTSSGPTEPDEDGGGENESDQPNDPEEKAAWFGIVLADAVDRITKKEVREIQRRIGQDAEMDFVKLSEWIDGFYEKHAEFMYKTLSALGLALESNSKKLHTDIIVEQYIDFTKADLCICCTRAAIEEWAAGRSELLSETIKGSITCKERLALR